MLLLKSSKPKKLKGILKKRSNDQERCVGMLVSKYDVNHDKTLSEKELKAMLKDLDSTHEPTNKSVKYCMNLIKDQEKNEFWTENVMNVVQRYNTYWREEDLYEGCLKKYVDVSGEFKIPSKQDLKTEMEIIGQEANLSVNESDVDIVMELFEEAKPRVSMSISPTNNVKKTTTEETKTESQRKLEIENKRKKHRIKAALSEWKEAEIEKKKQEEEQRPKSCCLIV